MSELADHLLNPRAGDSTTTGCFASVTAWRAWLLQVFTQGADGIEGKEQLECTEPQLFATLFASLAMII